MKYIPATPIRLLMEINSMLVANARQGQDAVIELPSAVELATMLTYEAGVIPISVVDVEVEGG